MTYNLNEAYLNWLYKQIGNTDTKNPSRTHWKFAVQLYTKEFIWLVPNDDNRKADGIDLRYEFLDANNIEEPDIEWMSTGCSMLELLIGLSHRLSFETGEESRAWFWELCENMGIGMRWSCDRDYNNEKAIEIDEALDRVIWRTYSPSGLGGLFPLPTTHENQREVELWYQMSAYILSDL